MAERILVRIPTPLRGYTGGADEVAVAGETVLDALRAVERDHAGILDRVLSPEGELRQFVNVYVGSQNVRALTGLATPLREGDVLAIVPAVAGGKSAMAGGKSTMAGGKSTTAGGRPTTGGGRR